MFVQNIKLYCARKGVRPTAACRESGAGKDLLNQLERQRSIPSVEKVQQLAQYLGVTTSELLGETLPATLRDSAARVPEDAQRLTVAEVELILAYRRADPRAQMVVHLTLEPWEKEATSLSG